MVGAKCGATSIDRQFVKWMERNFGKAYTKLDIKKRGPGSLFMDDFESQKRNFGNRDDDRDVYEVGPIDMDWDDDPEKYDDGDSVVKISK